MDSESDLSKDKYFNFSISRVWQDNANDIGVGSHNILVWNLKDRGRRFRIDHMTSDDLFKLRIALEHCIFPDTFADGTPS